MHVDPCLTRSPRRTQGRPAILLRLRRLVLMVGRYARTRATTPADQGWAGALLEDLLAALGRAERPAPVLSGLDQPAGGALGPRRSAGSAAVASAEDGESHAPR